MVDEAGLRTMRAALEADGYLLDVTEEGERLLSYARRILTLAQEAREVVGKPTGEGVVRLGIPEDAILIDPHARHTTTNLRNAARLMYRYGIPFDRKALVTTDPTQSRGIQSPAFVTRCNTELGYMPVRVIGRINLFDLEFLPLKDALQADPQDPLDP